MKGKISLIVLIAILIIAGIAFGFYNPWEKTNNQQQDLSQSNSEMPIPQQQEADKSSDFTLEFGTGKRLSFTLPENIVANQADAGAASVIFFIDESVRSENIEDQLFFMLRLEVPVEILNPEAFETGAEIEERFLSLEDYMTKYSESELLPDNISLNGLEFRQTNEALYRYFEIANVPFVMIIEKTYLSDSRVQQIINTIRVEE
jgi:hypothetical protein